MEHASKIVQQNMKINGSLCLPIAIQCYGCGDRAPVDGHMGRGGVELPAEGPCQELMLLLCIHI